jgi:hypothetical protein
MLTIWAYRVYIAGVKAVNAGRYKLVLQAFQPQRITMIVQHTAMGRANQRLRFVNPSQARLI